MNLFMGKNKLNFLTFLTAVFYIFYISGYKSQNVNYIISGGAVVLFAMYLLLRKSIHRQNLWHARSFKMLIIFLILHFFYLGIYGEGQIKNTVAQFMYFFPMITYLFYEKDTDQLKGFFSVLIISWIFFAFRAYYMYSNSLVEAREMASGVLDKNVFTGGGYGFAIGSSIFAVFLFEMLIWGNIKRYKLFVLAFVVLLAFVVRETKSTITILAISFGFFTAVIFRLFNICSLKKISNTHFILLVCVIILLVVFFMYKRDLGMYIAKSMKYKEDIVSKRFHEIGVFLANSDNIGGQSSDLNERMLRLQSSWKVFLDNALMGVTYKFGTDTYTLALYGIGSHGELLDILAKFGLLGGVPYLLVFLFGFLNERRLQKRHIGFGYIVTFVILFYFNPFIFFPSMTAFFLLIPATTRIFNSVEIQEKEKGKVPERI